MFSSEYYDISNNNCFEENLRGAASKINKEKFLEKAACQNDNYKINMGS